MIVIPTAGKLIEEIPPTVKADVFVKPTLPALSPASIVTLPLTTLEAFSAKFEATPSDRASRLVAVTVPGAVCAMPPPPCSATSLPETGALMLRLPAAADVDRELILRGQRLGENDSWIAGFCLYYREPVISLDQAFARVPRLRRITH